MEGRRFRTYGHCVRAQAVVTSRQQPGQWVCGLSHMLTLPDTKWSGEELELPMGRFPGKTNAISLVGVFNTSVSWRPLTTQAFCSDPLRCPCRAALRHCFHRDWSRASWVRLAALPGQFAWDRSSRLAPAHQLHPCWSSLFMCRCGSRALRSAAHWTPRRASAHRRSGHRADWLGTVRHRLRW